MEKFFSKSARVQIKKRIKKFGKKLNESYIKKRNAFTLAEALITLVIIGVIAAITIPQMKSENYSRKAWETMANKTIANLTQVSIQILLNYATLDDYLRLKDDDGTYFSIEDEGAVTRIASIYRKFMANTDATVKLSDTYFSNDIKNYQNKSIGFSLKNSYSGFYVTNDGVLIGFRLYGSCATTETNTFPPGYRESYSIDNVCGSVFFDINALKKPNKLGSDQFIIPIGKRGVEYDNNNVEN